MFAAGPAPPLPSFPLEVTRGTSWRGSCWKPGLAPRPLPDPLPVWLQVMLVLEKHDVNDNLGHLCQHPRLTSWPKPTLAPAGGTIGSRMEAARRPRGRGAGNVPEAT